MEKASNISDEINIFKENIKAFHYVRRPSSLACCTELQAKTELNQQHFGWEDPWQWNLDNCLVKISLLSSHCTM